jgi:hypothetical protein
MVKIFIATPALHTRYMIGWDKESDKFYLKKKMFEKFCWYCAWNGADGVTIFPNTIWHVNSIDEMVQPFQLESGKFNLEKLRDDHWQILQDINEITRMYNLQVLYKLFDQCGTHFNQPNLLFNPWLNNHQGVEHFVLGIFHSMNYIHKCIDIFPDAIFELCNEFGFGGLYGPPRQVEDEDDKIRYTSYDLRTAIRWGMDVAKILKARGIPANRVSFGAHWHKPWNHSLLQSQLKRGVHICSDEIYGEESKFSIYRPVHGKDDYNHIKSGFQLSWLVSDDGWYVPEDEQHKDVNPWRPGRARPNGNEWREFSRKVCANYKAHDNFKNNAIVEHLPKLFTEEVQAPTIVGISEGYKDVYGRYPSNWRRTKYKGAYDPKPEPEVPIPEPVPEPPKPPIVQKWRFFCINKRFPYMHLDFRGAWKRYKREIIIVTLIALLFFLGGRIL